MPSICAAFGLLVLVELEHLQDVRALELVEGGHVIAYERRERGTDGGRAWARDIGDLEDVAGREDHRALDRVLELTHVARPALRREVRERGIGEHHPTALGAQRGLLGEVTREQPDIARAIAQRRHLDRDDREPIIEILPEHAGGDLTLQRAIRRIIGFVHVPIDEPVLIGGPLTALDRG